MGCAIQIQLPAPQWGSWATHLPAADSVVVPTQTWIPSGDFPWLKKARSPDVTLSSWGQFMWNGWDTNTQPSGLSWGRTLHGHLTLGPLCPPRESPAPVNFCTLTSTSGCFSGRLTYHTMLCILSTHQSHRKPSCKKVTRSHLWFRRSPVAPDWSRSVAKKWRPSEISEMVALSWRDGYIHAWGVCTADWGPRGYATWDVILTLEETLLKGEDLCLSLISWGRTLGVWQGLLCKAG